MTASHQSGPLFIGPDAPRVGPSADGAVVLTQKYDLTVTDATSGTGFDAFRLPADAELIDVQILVVVASNSATSAVIKLTDGTDDIVVAFDAKSAAKSLLSVKNGDGDIDDAALFLAPTGGVDKNLQLVYTQSGAASAGRVIVYVMYVQKGSE
jgi:hypothetical protein